MKHLVAPLLLATIIADAWFWWHYDTISVDTFWIGENCVYIAWVAAFLIYVKNPPTEFERKIIVLILWSWLPFSVNSLWRQTQHMGSEKSPWDLYSGFASLLIVFIQIIVWWYKSSRSK